MNTDSGRLNDIQVEALAEAFKEIEKTASTMTFIEYQLSRDSSRRIGIMRAHDFPREGITTANSLGLAHETWTDANFPDRLELVQAWDCPSLEYERLLVVVAESMIMRKRPPKPGVIYRDAVRVANLPELAARMPHAMVMFPYFWGREFSRIELEGARVWCMQVVPIYEKEMRFVEQRGFAKFEELLGYDGAYFEQLQRPSHIGKL